MKLLNIKRVVVGFFKTISSEKAYLLTRRRPNILLFRHELIGLSNLIST